MSPRFKFAEINSRLFKGDIGDAFQRFVFDLLRPEFQTRGFNLRLYPGGGKDGGIDLAATKEEQSAWLECKVCGEDTPAKVRAEWEAVAAKLSRFLASPDGPPRGQSQYTPWYRQTPRIEGYIFCTTAKMGNEAKSDELRKLEADIHSFFQKLSADYLHLSHLQKIQVEVLDWFDFETRLLDRKHLLFRWFPQTHLTGLLPFEDAGESPDSYRAYLYTGRLPYYSRTDYAEVNQPPPGVLAESESELLTRLAPTEKAGIIVSGPGGVGKTRLTFELARAALHEGWVVFMAGPSLAVEQLRELAQGLDPADRVLIVFDYVEIQRDFLGLIEAIQDVNDASGLHLRYVASSRTAFYRSTLATEAGHHHVDLSPLTHEAVRSWLDGYFGAAVQHILTKGLGTARPGHLAVCGHTPALAVFLTYLQATGRGQELEALAEDQDFSRWVLRRLKMTFGTQDVTPDVAALAAMLPAPEAMVAHLSGPRPQIFDRLVEDGWVERHDLGLGPVYAAIHDVLADQIFLHHLSRAPATRATFLEALVADAIRVGTLDSVLITLQRVSDAPALEGISLFGIIARSMETREDAWRAVALRLLRLSLLTTAEKLRLHQRFPRVWEGWETSVELHNLLGWLAREVVKSAGEPLPEELRGYLTGWLEVVAPYVDRSNYLLTWGLRLAPERLHDPALAWITSRFKLFQTHYLGVAWLEAKLPAQYVREPLRRWLENFATAEKASFIYRAWLDATQDPEPVREYIRVWLPEHHTTEDAQFVYRAWLDAIKDKATKDQDSQMVRDYIEAWLRLHHTKEVAQFVYCSWLDATKDKEPELVENCIWGWLQKHYATEDAQFVYCAWLDATQDPEPVREYIQAWLPLHHTKEVAQFVYCAWLDATQDPEPVREYIRAWLPEHHTKEEAGFVYRGWLDATQDKEPELVENCIWGWLQKHYAMEDANFVYRAWLDATQDYESVKEYFLAWVEQWQDYDELDYVLRAWLEAGGSFQAVQEPSLRWLHAHAIEERAVFLMKYLAKLRDLPVESVLDVLAWCQAHAQHEDAIWRLDQLGGDVWKVEDIALWVTTVERVVIHRLEVTSHDSRLPKMITSALCYLVVHRGTREGALRPRVDDLFLRWLRHPSSFGASMRKSKFVQHSGLLFRVTEMLANGQLGVQADRALLEKFLDWVETWNADRKARLANLLKFAAKKFPSPGLWDRVKIENTGASDFSSS